MLLKLMLPTMLLFDSDGTIEPVSEEPSYNLQDGGLKTIVRHCGSWLQNAAHMILYLTYNKHLAIQ